MSYKNEVIISLPVKFYFNCCYSTVSFAQANKGITTSSTYEIIEGNYLSGLNPGNHGLKLAAHISREI